MKTERTAASVLAFAAVTVTLALLIRQFGLSALTGAFPLAQTGTPLGMVFLIGLITSVHCAAMCGGINLTQTLEVKPTGPEKTAPALGPSLLYNSGRVISYTAAGALVGALGSVVTFSGALRGAVQLIAGVFMVVMGANMAGLLKPLRRFMPTLPRFLSLRVEEAREKAAERKTGPLVVGLLNGFMPCGPLQAMQLYALSTGSALSGAAAMFLFSLGTVPLMFGLGALSTFLSHKFTRGCLAAGSVLVAALGITMFSQGWALSGLGSLDTPGRPAPLMNSAAAGSAAAYAVVSNTQVVNSTLSARRYPAITVAAGMPVKWTIDAPAGAITGCNNRMLIRDYGIEHRFTPGANLIEFTPTKPGIVRYSCWMGMIRSTITVVPPGTDLSAAATSALPTPALVVIPTGSIAVAVLGTEQGTTVQRVRVTLDADGFHPAVIVVQRGIPAEWLIDNRSGAEVSLLVPAFAQEIPLGVGESPLYLSPTETFDFSAKSYTANPSPPRAFGYAKVVPNITLVDTAAVKAEAAAFKTLDYPPGYFEE